MDVFDFEDERLRGSRKTGDPVNISNPERRSVDVELDPPCLVHAMLKKSDDIPVEGNRLPDIGYWVHDEGDLDTQVLSSCAFEIALSAPAQSTTPGSRIRGACFVKGS
jgi:hypothetical protein